MIPTTDTEPLTAASVLLADELPADRIAGLLAEAEIWAAARPAQVLEDASLRHIEQQLAQHAASILDTDLLALLFAGWRKWSALQEAARCSVRTTERLAVPLASHRVESRQLWNVEVHLYNLRLTGVQFVLTTTFDLDAPQAQLGAGRLLGLAGGRCELVVRFEVCAECLQHTAKKRRPALEARRAIDLAARISCGDGIPLLSSAEAARLAS
jgi:hypothetical protein